MKTFVLFVLGVSFGVIADVSFGNEIIGNFLNVNANNTFMGHPFLEAIRSIYFDGKLERVKELCAENRGEGAFEELEKAGKSFKECIEHIPLLEDIELPSKICPGKIDSLRNCFNEHKVALGACEKIQEIFLTDYLSDTVLGIVQYGCEEIPHLLSELSTSLKRMDCLAYFIQEWNKSVKHSMFSCMKEAQHKEGPEEYFTKQRFCKRITDTKDCALNLVKEKCEDNKIVKDFIVGLAGAAKRPCIVHNY